MEKRIGIIDYGAGNLFSIDNAVKKINRNRFISSDPEKLKHSDFIIFPGVGSFSDGIINIRNSGLDEFICEFYNTGKPILGICLGMQLLFETGYEGGENNGIGLLKGKVEKLQHRNNSRIPHIGWNDVYGENFNETNIMEGIPLGSSFYFVHSYHAVPAEPINLIYTDFYGQDIVAGVIKNNLIATQFHPEKSQIVGLKLLNNFVSLFP